MAIWEYAVLELNRMRLYPRPDGTMSTAPTEPGQHLRGDFVLAVIADWFGPDGKNEEWTTEADWTEPAPQRLVAHLNRAGAQGWVLAETTEERLTTRKQDEVPAGVRVLPPDLTIPSKVQYLFRREVQATN